MDIYDSIAELKKSGEGFVVATVVEAKGSTPRDAGAKMLIRKNGSVLGSIGGGAIEKIIIEEALKLFSAPKATTLHYNLGELKMQCGGKMTLFLEPVIPSPQLLIFGAGHIGFALAQVADILGYRIVVIDNRPEFAVHERFPMAQQIIAGDYMQAFESLQFDDTSHIVIVTHKHLHDEAILQKCVDQPFCYLGMIGSRTKVQKALAALKENRVDPQTIKRIHSPIGLAIGAQTPEEIAVAVAAEMIAIRRGADVSTLSMRVSHD